MKLTITELPSTTPLECCLRTCLELYGTTAVVETLETLIKEHLAQYGETKETAMYRTLKGWTNEKGEYSDDNTKR